MEIVEGGKSEAGERPELVDANITQLTPETIEALRKRHILREAEADIELPPFGPGMERIGILNDEEKALFIEVTVLDSSLYEWMREITARTHEKIAGAVRSSDSPEAALDKLQKDMVFANDEEAEEYFEEIYRKDYLNSLLWFNVRSRLGVYGANLSICYGYAIARAGYKYKVSK